VDLATTTHELVVQFTPQLEQPAIMVMGCASPDGAGMVEVSNLVDIIGPHAASHTMSSGEQLCVLDDHLGAVLVTVVLGTFLWITIKEKDVHAYIIAEDSLMSTEIYERCWKGYEPVPGKKAYSDDSCRKKNEAAYKGARKAIKERKGKMPKMKMGVHKSRSGGLTAAGVKKYRAANPGSKLKTAVTTKPSKLKKGSKAANRRKSFCSRMGGMKKRLTSKKTANDPDSRINKALRKWNC